MTTHRERNGDSPLNDQPDVNQGDDAAMPPAGGEPHDAVGAYLLDALPEEERIAFETHLLTCEPCRQEVAELAPVVQLLPRLLEEEPGSDQDAPAQSDDQAPAPELRERILAAARAEKRLAPPRDPAAHGGEDEPGGDEAAPVEPASAVTKDDARAGATQRDIPPVPSVPVAPPVRPRGRIRGGVTPSAGSVIPLPVEAVARWPRAWLAAAVLAIAFAGAVIWGLALQGRIDDKNREIAALRLENQTIRARANATAWRIVPTADGPGNAEGTLFFSLPDQRGVVYVVHLPPLPGDRVYQLWYLENAPSAAPVPGATFTVDAQGQGFAPVDPKAPAFDAIALTEEPAGGSEQPTSAVLMIGQLAGAAGQRADPATAAWAFAQLDATRD